MKMTVRFAVTCLLLGVGAILCNILYPSNDFFADLIVFVCARALVGLAFIALIIAAVVDFYQTYVALPEKERQAINEIACPAIDAGLRHLKDRDDGLGKAASFLHNYRRYARQYQKK